jgi:CheY-like chemotaxis protein
MLIDTSTPVRDIFLVEDDDGLRTLEAKILSGLPEVGIREFEQAETALDGFAQMTPSLLISDLGLPGMSGVELITRARSKFPRVPVLVTTGSQSEFEQKLRRLPFVELWEKPFSLQDLRDRVHDVLVAETAVEAAPEPDPFVFSPFTVVDYLQMANFGQRSLLLEVRLHDGRTGRVEILRGEIWRCRLGDLRGLDALRAILELPDVPVDFLPLIRIPKEREITNSTSGVLLELAVAQDEGRLSA